MGENVSVCVLAGAMRSDGVAVVVRGCGGGGLQGMAAAMLAVLPACDLTLSLRESTALSKTLRLVSGAGRDKRGDSKWRAECNLPEARQRNLRHHADP